MRYLSLIIFSTLCLLFACTKDNVLSETGLQNPTVGDRTNEKVTICHVDEYGVFSAISVSVSALEAHLAHGDYLPDADGDGYTAVGACTGSMDDCDDNNAAVNPGATEICDNGIDDNCDGNIDEGCCTDCCFPLFTEETFEGENFIFYYDATVNNCDGFSSDFLLLQGASFFVEVGQQIVLLSGGKYGSCGLIVGVDITLEEYEAALATLRAIIAANPQVPNYCDLFNSPDPTQMAQFKSLLDKAKSKKPSNVNSQ